MICLILKKNKKQKTVSFSEKETEKGKVHGWRQNGQLGHHYSKLDKR